MPALQVRRHCDVTLLILLLLILEVLEDSKTPPRQLIPQFLQ